jgi:hypothetical protein
LEIFFASDAVVESGRSEGMSVLADLFCELINILDVLTVIAYPYAYHVYVIFRGFGFVAFGVYAYSYCVHVSISLEVIFYLPVGMVIFLISHQLKISGNNNPSIHPSFYY